MSGEPSNGARASKLRWRDIAQIHVLMSPG